MLRIVSVTHQTELPFILKQIAEVDLGAASSNALVLEFFAFGPKDELQLAPNPVRLADEMVEKS